MVNALRLHLHQAIREEIIAVVGIGVGVILGLDRTIVLYWPRFLFLEFYGVGLGVGKPGLELGSSAHFNP